MRKRLLSGSFSNSSTVRMPAMPLPITTRCSRGSVIMFMMKPPLDAGRGQGGAFAAPARPHRDDPGKGHQRHAGKDGKAEGIAAGELLGVTQAGGEIEAADAAGHAHQA